MRKKTKHDRIFKTNRVVDEGSAVEGYQQNFHIPTFDLKLKVLIFFLFQDLLLYILCFASLNCTNVFIL